MNATNWNSPSNAFHQNEHLMKRKDTRDFTYLLATYEEWSIFSGLEVDMHLKKALIVFE